MNTILYYLEEIFDKFGIEVPSGWRLGGQISRLLGRAAIRVAVEE